MTYTPPTSNAVNFELTGGYSAPVFNSVDFEMAEVVIPTASPLDVTAGVPDIGVIHCYSTYGIVSITDFISGIPDIENIVVTNPACSPINVVSGIPDIENIVVSNPAVRPVGVFSGAPVIDSIAATQVYSPCSIADVVAGSPVVQAISAMWILAVPLDVISGVPDIGSPHALSDAATPIGVVSGSPVIDSIVVTSIGCSIEDVVSGVPVVPDIVVSSTYGIVSISDVVSGAPDIGSPAVELWGARISDIVSGLPDIGRPVASSVTAIPISVISGIPVVGTPGASFEALITSNAVLVYLCTLTGTTDIEIPIKSFQSRLRSGAETYLSVVVPGKEYIDEIDARSDGQIIIETAYLVAGVERQRTEIIRVNLDTVRVDEGPVDYSITLTGYRQETYMPNSADA
ncbi:hypothetical protein [uncultured Desulfobacter sp.]|uniref:hypothetical protein n=1 Tax=uncultured Desulfobacter sp. TaxID=240139 RepID=UPI0029C95187|nr:hypothetical protein [uncultured Desulfobacter sp.]